MDVELRHTRTIVYRCRVFQQAMIDYQRVYVSPSGGSITNLAELQKLVGGWATPLKNMSSSVGMMKFPIYIYGKIKFMFQNHQIDKLQPENSWLFFRRIIPEIHHPSDDRILHCNRLTGILHVQFFHEQSSHMLDGTVLCTPQLCPMHCRAHTSAYQQKWG